MKAGVVAVTLPLAHHQGRGQGRDTGVDVDHRAPGEIQGPQVLEPAAVTPDPVGHRTVNQREPQNHEHQKRAELQALGKGAGDQGRGDNREHALIDHEGLMGNGLRISLKGFETHPGQTHPIQVADEVSHVRAEGQAVAVNSPQHADEPQEDKILHDRAQDIFAPHHAPIKQSQPRGHEHDQGCGY